MSAKYWQRGETIDYTATEAVSNGRRGGPGHPDRRGGERYCGQ